MHELILIELEAYAVIIAYDQLIWDELTFLGFVVKALSQMSQNDIYLRWLRPHRTLILLKPILTKRIRFLHIDLVWICHGVISTRSTLVPTS